MEGLFRLGLHFRASRTGRRAPLPVVSVGSLWVGGAGKSPLAGELAAIAAEEALAPAILLRGYGARIRGVARVPAGSLDAQLYGDEAAMHAARSPAAVYVGPDRLRAALQAAREGCRLAILDDGMQHPSIARDLEIVTLRGERPLGNGRLLPRGPLREPPVALRRAHLIVLAHTAGSVPPVEAVETVRRHAPGIPIFSWRDRIELLPLSGQGSGRAVTGASSQPGSTPGRVGAFAGIAWPSAFRRALEAQESRGWKRTDPVWNRRARGDPRAGLRDGCEGVITTEKDAARLGGPTWAWLPSSVRVARLSIAWNEPEARPALRAMLVGLGT
jgi:tetraacyldisaccharide 4'-kinase